MESARFDSAGNLGIGTSSPNYRADVLSSNFRSLRVQSSGDDAIITMGSQIASSQYWSIIATSNTSGQGANRFLINTTDANAGGTVTNRLCLDASGNLGLGVTPSAWSNGYKALQIGQSSFSSVGNAVYLWQNIYQDSGGTNRYISTGTAGLTGWEGNTYKWYQAPSGTAGNAISFTEAMTLDASGNLLVGRTDTAFTSGQPGMCVLPTQGITFTKTTSPNLGACMYLHRTFGAGTGNLVEFAYDTVVRGSISTNGTGVTYGTASDYRLKNTIAPMTGALAKVAQLKPVTYKWNVDGSDGEGFIAHELQEIVPECVTGEKDAVDAEGKPVYQGIDTSFLVATLTAALQEAHGLIKDQAAAIQTLTARVTALEGTQP